VNRLRRLGFGLPSELWVVQVGIFLNYFGWGAVLPFEIIYLHEGRGFSLGVAGLVVGTVTGLAVLTAPFSGPVIDRIDSRITAAAALVALAGGFVGLAFAHTPLQASSPPPRPGSAAAGSSRASRRCWPRSRRRSCATAPPLSRASPPTSGSASAERSAASSRLTD
jgi:MFS family permease